MPDRNLPDPRGAAPQDWPTAFAQLPAETPPADGWAQVAARLASAANAAPPAGDMASSALPATGRMTATRRHVPHRRRWAMAAMLAAALPLAWWLSQRGADPIMPATQPAQVVHTQNPSPDRVIANPPLSPSTQPQPDPGKLADTGERSTDHAADHATDRATDRAIATAPNPSNDANKPAPRTAKPQRDASPGTRERRAPTRLAANETAPTPQALANNDSDAIVQRIGELQAQSAQLEALIAASRDDRVASATAAVMSSELDQRLGLIDATLIAAPLPASQRLSLWQQRVGTLRALAGVESTQRWFAAQGERYDDALVRVD
ncbi:hypothetical protein [Lysobacter sp. Root690]|uniref:hypothetical protein n=1 Tax=Lysobacter sp. Root690 TaxID=1736588 RepID=UPI0006F303F7|nr:hypothetical protein [Lysobacter sp. Root690]KRB02646.1 hypothetical protein ASD86_24455 [Lysobacter sp. Root690]